MDVVTSLARYPRWLNYGRMVNPVVPRLWNWGSRLGADFRPICFSLVFRYCFAMKIATRWRLASSRVFLLLITHLWSGLQLYLQTCGYPVDGPNEFYGTACALFFLNPYAHARANWVF